MTVKVLTGKKLKRDQAKVTRLAQRREFENRVSALAPEKRYGWSGLPDYLSWVNVATRPRRNSKSFYDFADRAKDNPDVSLAIIDFVEGSRKIIGAKEQRTSETKVIARGVLRRFLWGLKAFKVIVKVVAVDAYAVAAEMERLVCFLTSSYDATVFRRLAIVVDVIEPPIYISPRSEFKALTEAAS